MKTLALIRSRHGGARKAVGAAITLAGIGLAVHAGLLHLAAMPVASAAVAALVVTLLLMLALVAVLVRLEPAAAVPVPVPVRAPRPWR